MLGRSSGKFLEQLLEQFLEKLQKKNSRVTIELPQKILGVLLNVFRKNYWKKSRMSFSRRSPRNFYKSSQRNFYNNPRLNMSKKSRDNYRSKHRKKKKSQEFLEEIAVVLQRAGFPEKLLEVFLGEIPRGILSRTTKRNSD